MKRSKMEPLKDISNSKLSSVPKLEFVTRSPPKLGSPSRLDQPPVRVSPFKGAKSTMTDQEIFSMTPRRLAYNKTKSQSADRPSGVMRHEISFASMKPASMTLKMNQTPSRLVSSNKNLSFSEQPISRLKRSAASKKVCEPNISLLNSAATKPILKRKFSPPVRMDVNEGDDTDLRTQLNTQRNTGSARSNMRYLYSSNSDLLPSGKKRLVTFEKESEPQDETIRLLQEILKNQSLILQRLEALENRNGL